MGRVLRVTIASLFLVSGVVGCVVLLSGQGLDRAEKWTSLVGVFLSASIGLIGLVTGTGRAEPGRVLSRTGKATAVGPGSLANSGLIGGAGGSVRNTGDAEARGGGTANTGDDRRGRRP
ncbi:hypothetical protein AB0368_38165 [Actinoplanes sp. NPDC051475]|uniref:hypothetical protein n=1 Tax=Actinoplanes sp. NPDC051475 TaxID=3157225 RepID=UPI00344F95CB